MRYLIIDTQPESEDDSEWISTTFGTAFKGEMLSPEETEAKFREVWDECVNELVMPGICIEQELTEEIWDKLRRNL